MGITGKFAMPFLSTLAALVIIVHSTEEDTESDFRRDLRPRILDTGTPTYDQPWRVVDQETMIQKSTQSEAWNDNSSEEPPKRRRYGRKRKRRPQSSLNEDQDPQTPQNRYGFPEEPVRPYFEVEVPNARQTTEVQTNRRRKKLVGRPVGWTEDPLELERPLRRRGQRRKRPSLEAWPQLSEFNDFKIEDAPKEANTEKDTIAVSDDIHNEKIQQDFLNKTNEDEQITEQTPAEEDSDNPSSDVTNGFTLPPQENDFELLINKPELEEDKSLSEFSIEVMTHAHEPEVNEEIATLQTKMGEKISGVLNEHDKSMDHGPIDPVTLKDLLKRSNGGSLSEILQQNNLTLADLLRGKENAISILKSESTYEYRRKPIPDIFAEISKDEEINVNEANSRSKKEQEESENRSKQLLYNVTNNTIDLTPQNTNSEISSFFHNGNDAVKETNAFPITTTTEKTEIGTQKIMTRIRFPTGHRKKLRMRPLMNTTYKAQLSRDLIALNARKYIHHRRNNTKLKEWKNILPSLSNKAAQQAEKAQVNENTEINFELENTTTLTNVDLLNNNTKDAELGTESLISERTTQESATPKVKVMDFLTNVTEDNLNISEQKQVGAMLGNRRHPYNRKKKRVRQKVSTTESSRGHIVNNFLGKDNFEISRPINRVIIDEAEAFPTNLEDFMTTSPPNIQINSTRSVKSTTLFSTTRHPTTQSTTEESARIEIDEILNDTGASARLSKILVERNMTLSELVEHRERGSSHVHLADIFHNASKEPNPPEPFLSKSLIEPISKETYPLRAILEANLHDANVKATTIDPSMIDNNYIPVVMNFGSNVNENAENMGIMSLFSNFTRFNVNSNKGTNTSKAFNQSQNLEDNSETTTHMNNSSSNLRESRVLSDVISHNNQDDVTSWNEIFSLMKKNYMNETKDLLESYHEEASSEGIKKINVEEDIDGEGLIVLEDLQHLRDFDNNIASLEDEKLEFNSMERTDGSPGILQTFPSQTKSVTVATASIAGLAIVLFLLTYAAFKWKQQRGISGHKHNFSDERVPTPVFESRKGHKNNSSNRSISPMLSTSNIYTLNTLDSRNGKESPEYMWDTLRKPFQ